jgi:hypothetical protein
MCHHSAAGGGEGGQAGESFINERTQRKNKQKSGSRALCSNRVPQELHWGKVAAVVHCARTFFMSSLIVSLLGAKLMVPSTCTVASLAPSATPVTICVEPQEANASQLVAKRSHERDPCAQDGEHTHTQQSTDGPQRCLNLPLPPWVRCPGERGAWSTWGACAPSHRAWSALDAA